MEENNDHTVEDAIRHRAEAPGCMVTSEDTPLIISSVACFLSFLVYGACVGCLGAALPAMAVHFNVSESKMGLAFTTRGVGYLVGTLSSAALIEFKRFKDLNLSKELLVGISVIITGLGIGFISATSKFSVILFLYFVQGLGFGGIDTLANCVLPELWGTRVQPWMQSLHSFFGIGAVIGPSLVGGLGFHNAFILLAIISIIPCIFIGIAAIFGEKHHPDLTPTDESPFEKVLDNESADNKEIAVVEEENCKPSVIYVPSLLRILITIFFFIYVGSETGFGGWISTFVLNRHVTNSKPTAAFMASMFWAAITAGRLLAIPSAVYLSTTTMLRAQLFLAVVGSLLIYFIGSLSLSGAYVATAVYGFALSSIFPLAMTLVGDYGFTM